MSKTITINISEHLNKLESENRKLKDECLGLVTKAEAEDRDLTPAEKEQLADGQKRMVSLRERIDRFKGLASEQAGDEDDDAPESRTRQRSQRKDDPEDAENADDEREELQKRAITRANRRHARAFSTYVRSGMANISEEDRAILQGHYAQLDANDRHVRALSAVTGASGGYTVPQEWIGQIESAMKDYSGVLQTRVSTLNTSTGADLPWPTDDDTSNEGVQVEENQDAGLATDPKFGAVVFKGYLFTTRVMLVPLTLLQDSAFDIETWLQNKAAERIGRILNRRWTTGNGANQPQGIVTGSALGKQAANAGSITDGDLYDLQGSLDAAYDNAAEWEFNKNTFTAIRKLKDSDGRSLWMPAMNASIAAGAPGLLLDRPYFINAHMADIGSGNRSVIYGDHRKYYIRRIRGMQMVRLSERYAEKFQVGFLGYVRADGRMINAGSNPIRHLVHP